MDIGSCCFVAVILAGYSQNVQSAASKHHSEELKLLNTIDVNAKEYLSSLFLQETNVWQYRMTLVDWLPSAEIPVVPEDKVLITFRDGPAQFLFYPCNVEMDATYACYGHRYMYLSSELFHKYVPPLLVPRMILGKSSHIVTSFTFSYKYLLLVMDGHVLALKIKSHDHYKISVGLSDAVTDVTANPCCEAEHSWCKTVSQYVVAWNNKIEGNKKLYISLDAGLTFSFQLLPLKEDIVFIRGVVVIIARHALAVLLWRKDGNAQVLHVQLKGYRIKGYKPAGNDSTPAVLARSPPFHCNGYALRFATLANLFGGVLIWDDETLWYSANSGLAIKEVPLYLQEHNGTHLLLKLGTVVKLGSIYTVASSVNGKFALLSSDGTVLYGFETPTSDIAAMQLRPLAMHIRNYSVVIFNEERSLMIVYSSKADMLHLVDNSPVKLRQRSLDIAQDINWFSQRSETGGGIQPCMAFVLQCQYVQETFLLDKNELFPFWVSFVQADWAETQLLVTLSDPHLLTFKVKKTGKSSFSFGKKIHKWTVVLSSRHEVMDYGPEENRGLGVGSTTGISYVMLSTDHVSMRCLDNPQVVNHVSVGCPPNKEIRISYENSSIENCGKFKYNYQYKIRNGKFLHSHLEHEWSKGRTFKRDENNDLVVSYDYQSWGCPVEPFNILDYTPILHLFQDNKDMGRMKADFVVYEIHGINDYSYTKHVQDVNCMMKPQSWKEMFYDRVNSYDKAHHTAVHKGELTKVSQWDAWTKKNYINCKSIAENRMMMSEASLEEKMKNFEILGVDHEWGNSIKWDGDSEKMYVFEAIVLDNEYSFCDLRTKFAVVQPVSSSERANIPPLVITAGVLLCSIAVICLSYLLLRDLSISNYWRNKEED